MERKQLIVRCGAVAIVLMLGYTAFAGQAGLVGYWRFDEGQGATAFDSSGNGLDGTLQGGPTWVEGFIGGALDFNGSSAYVEVPNNALLNLTTEITIAAWTYMRANASGEMAIVSKGGWAANNLPYELTEDAAGVIFWQFYDNEGRDTCSPDSPPAGEWHHIAATYDGQIFKCYIDGALGEEWAYAGTMPVNTASLTIGRRSTGGTFFNGMIDEVQLWGRALPEAEIQKIMYGLGNPALAVDPSPEDLATDVPCDVMLSWTAGKFAAAHDVYLGTVFDDVNDASRDDPRDVLAGRDEAVAEYAPDAPLEYGQTYYWRIDEVNAAPDSTIFKGNAWSFTTEPYAYPITNVTVNASSQQPTSPAIGTINGSGLDEFDQHSFDLKDMWMTPGGLPAWIQFTFDKEYRLHELWVWNGNSELELFMGFGVKDAVVEYSTDGETWTAVENVPQFAQGTGLDTYTANTAVDFGGVMAKCVKLTVNTTYGATGIASLSEVRFFYVPVQAFRPDPADGATGVSVEAELNWRPGREATSHQVYFGAVADGAAAPQTATDHSYAPSDLAYATEYFWKVDEVGGGGTYAGDVWSFTTEEYGVVDDFESYNDDIEAETTIWHAWIDGVTDKASGSQAGYTDAPFAEKTIVHSGVQSLPFQYDNTNYALSEATLAFDPAQDWTARDVKTLSVFFAGAAGNGGQLYVKINNTKISYDGDAADLARTGWQVWNIDLSKAGNVTSVRSLAIGIEGSGAKGILYIDDIRLYPKAPEFSTPVEPDSANLIARYAFNGDVKDGSGHNHNGTANGGPTYVVGVDGQALHLDGVDDYVAVGGVGISGAAPRTISGWVKADTTAITDWTNLLGFTSTPDGVDARSFDMNKMGGSGTYCIHAYGWERNIVTIDLEWHHLAATYDGTTVAWYGDGQFVASEDWVLNTQDNVQMGKRGHAAGANFPGAIDEVRIYNKALPFEEIAWLAGRRQTIYRPL